MKSQQILAVIAVLSAIQITTIVAGPGAART